LAVSVAPTMNDSQQQACLPLHNSFVLIF